MSTYGVKTRAGWYLDITEAVCWDHPNAIDLTVRLTKEAVWMGASLEYPFPDDGQVTAYPIAAPQTPTAGGIPPVITAAWTGGPFHSMADTTVFASTNLLPEALEGVYLSAQVNISPRGRASALSDVAMAFDATIGAWRYTIHMGDRRLNILDAPKLHLWARTKSGHVSETFHLEIQWELA
jgi:hypothetical protein